MRNTRSEHLSSEMPSIADIERTSRKVRDVPLGDIRAARQETQGPPRDGPAHFVYVG
jgi:hypothetical protein